MSTLEAISEKLYCRSCKRKTNQGVIQKYETSDNYEFAWNENYYIVKCLGCDTISFAKEYGDESMIYHDSETGLPDYYVEFEVYPPEPVNIFYKGEKTHITKEYVNVPELINMLYTQTVFSFNNRHYLLGAVGLRMIVEGVCKELSITQGLIRDNDWNVELDKAGLEKKNGNLIGKIYGLFDNGIIVRKQAEILHQIRELGNVSVHELVVPKRSTIISGIEVIENMLHNIFELDKYKIK